MGILRSIVAGIFSLGLILTVAVAHVLRVSKETLFEREVGYELLMELGLTQSQLGMATTAFILGSVVLVGLIFLVSGSIATTARSLGVSLVVAGLPVYAVAYVLKNRPEAVMQSLSYDLQNFVLELSDFTAPFIDTVSQQSLTVFVAGVALLVVARVLGAASS
ncbi:MAG: hypothetical protein ABEJ55_08785 [Halanaeroarchaeum sp.]